MGKLLSEKYRQWEQECSQRYSRLKANEEELNRIFISLYGLQNEVSPSAENITVRKANLQREIKSLISYAVGCISGRYSIDEKGLVYAGGVWNPDRYRTIIPEESGILPVGSPECFPNELTRRITEFFRLVYGEDTLQENLNFAASGLGGEGSPETVIRRYLLHEFYPDHCRIYQRKPIYWMFRSGKKQAFTALVYLHRWDSSTVRNLMIYVRKLRQYFPQGALASELLAYEEKLQNFIGRSISPDAGVTENYRIFSDILEKIR